MVEKVKYNIINDYDGAKEKTLIVSVEQAKVIDWLAENGYLNSAYGFEEIAGAPEIVDLS